MPQRFGDKCVLIIGGNSGIGLAAAKAFANEGARVMITGRDPETLRSATREIGRGAIAHVCDISDLRQIDALYEHVRRDCRSIDVLFVNAGFSVHAPLESVTEADWDLVQNTNLKGAFFSVQGAVPFMPKGAAIVMTSSIAAWKAAPIACVYSACKAGVRALARSFAAELVARGIRVNVVSPGFIETRLFERIKGLPREEIPELRERMVTRTPMKRMGTPEEVAAAVLYLASDEASFVTGIDLLVDGGIASF